jgi:hypothetical protein
MLHLNGLGLSKWEIPASNKFNAEKNKRLDCESPIALSFTVNTVHIE